VGDPDFCELPCAEGVRCGDGLITDGEECDDRVNTSHYFPDEGECAPNCKRAPRCGDGLLSVTRGEQCDHGPANAMFTYNGCTTTCQIGPRCGDGVVDPEFEACDDGNLQANDGCDAQCQAEK
jgi:cysteine-rich repeat protein